MGHLQQHNKYTHYFQMLHIYHLHNIELLYQDMFHKHIVYILISLFVSKLCDPFPFMIYTPKFLTVAGEFGEILPSTKC